MNDHEIAEALMGIAVTSDEPLSEYCAAPAEDDIHVAGAASYAEAEVLTRDAGFVLYMSDGTEFQITVVRSR